MRMVIAFPSKRRVEDRHALLTCSIRCREQLTDGVFCDDCAVQLGAEGAEIVFRAVESEDEAEEGVDGGGGCDVVGDVGEEGAGGVEGGAVGAEEVEEVVQSIVLEGLDGEELGEVVEFGVG